MVHVSGDESFLLGGGEMAALIRERDWSATSLGPIAGWSDQLRTAVELCLASRFPAAICWGPDYVLVYNDAYRDVLASKHPLALGRPCFDVWNELSHIVRPMFDGVVASGTPAGSDDLMLPRDRYGYLEEAYFSVSFAPVRGGSGQPQGVFATVVETTERCLAERRTRLLRELGDAAGLVRSLGDAIERTQSILTRHQADVPFALLYSIDRAANGARLELAIGVKAGSAAAPAQISAAHDAQTWPIWRCADRNDSVVVGDLSAFGVLPGGVWPEPAGAAVLVPIPQPGEQEAGSVLIAGINPRRALDDTYLEFLTITGRRIATLMANARAHEEARLGSNPLSDVELARRRREDEARLGETSRELRRRVLELETLLDVLPIGIGIATDRECRNIRINRAFAETLGLRPDANASKTATPDHRPTNFRILTPEGVEVPDDQLPMQLAAREGRENSGIELDIVHEDGRVIRLLEHAAPLFDEHGNPRGAVGAFVDVTASHHAKRLDQFLVRADDATRSVSEATVVAARYMHVLAEEIGAGAAAFCEIDSATPSGATLLGSYSTADGPRRRLDPENPALLDAIASGEPFITGDVGWDARPAATAANRLLGCRTALVVPVIERGQLAAFAAIGTFEPRQWRDADINLTRQAARRCFDAVARARVTRELAHSEQRYRRMVDTAGVAIWEQDYSGVKAEIDRLRQSGVDDVAAYVAAHPEFVDRCLTLVRMVDANRASLSMFGAVDKREMLMSLGRVLVPGTRPVFINKLLALARGDQRFESEAALQALDGRPIHALMTVTFSAPAESFGSVLVSLTDITDRKRSEDTLQQEVTVRATLAQVGASLASELNSDKLVQAVTDAATKLTSAEIGAFFHNVTDESGSSYSLFSVSGALKEAFSHLRQPRATEIFAPTFRGEAIVRLADVTRDPRYGSNVPYFGMPDGHFQVRSYLAVPVIARGGQVLGGLFFGHSRANVFTSQHEQLAAGVASWAAVALDNARLYRDLEEANRLKDEFLATLSHELRTPLNAVLGWAHMLREGAMKPSMRQRALESLERNARAQAQLVEDLLDVSRIMSGKLHIRAEAVQLDTIVANAIDTVRAGATAKRIHVDVHAEPGDPLIVTGDPDRLQQIVWNLMSNAIKFTPSGGRIDVEMRRIDGKAEIVIRDTGQGIDPAFHRHLFERFRQMDATPARRHGGLGLGLSIVRHLTEAHGGTVSAESDGEGMGATFRVRLPLRADAAQGPRPAVPAVPDSPRALASAFALVVDDEADARELVRYVLESRGARVVTASSAAEALQLIDENDANVLVADIGMPDQDGLALIRDIRRLDDETRRSIPAIAVTAYASVSEREQALRAGYGWHIAKPLEPEELVATVSAAVGDAAPRSPRRRTRKPSRKS